MLSRGRTLDASCAFHGVLGLSLWAWAQKRRCPVRPEGHRSTARVDLAKIGGKLIERKPAQRLAVRLRWDWPNAAPPRARNGL